ncbi:MAG: hypothetical protein ABH848_06090 [Candidatus Omnitrophota bacterium]
MKKIYAFLRKKITRGEFIKYSLFGLVAFLSTGLFTKKSFSNPNIDEAIRRSPEKDDLNKIDFFSLKV